MHGSGDTEIDSDIINGRDGPEDLVINGKIISKRIPKIGLRGVFYDELVSIIFLFLILTFKALGKILISVVNWIHLAHD
jgi:hypothetical protein